MRSHHGGLLWCLPTKHFVFLYDTAFYALWEREETPSYRKKSAHCSWRANIALFDKHLKCLENGFSTARLAPDVPPGCPPAGARAGARPALERLRLPAPPRSPPAGPRPGPRPALERLGLPAPRGPSPDRPTHQRLVAAGPRR